MVLRGGRLLLRHESGSREDPVHCARCERQALGHLAGGDRLADDELHGQLRPVILDGKEQVAHLARQRSRLPVVHALPRPKRVEATLAVEPEPPADGFLRDPHPRRPGDAVVDCCLLLQA